MAIENEKKASWRINYVTEFDLQFWFTLAIIFIVSVEGVFVGWGIHKLSVIASDWQSPDMYIRFFKTLGLILFLLMGGNFIIGMYLSHKVAGPVYKLRQALKEIKNGKIVNIRLRRGDLLKDFVKEFNETTMVLDKIIQRDQNFTKMASEQVDECLRLLDEDNSANSKKIRKVLVQIRSFLIAIGSHFKS